MIRYLCGLILLVLLVLSSCGMAEGTDPERDFDLGRLSMWEWDSSRPDERCEREFAVAYEPLHSILHLTHDEFLHSIQNPRPFPAQPTGSIVAGVVPHHNTAAVLISGFFSQVSDEDYDLVIILAPNHEGDIAQVVLSYRHWDIGDGVRTNRQFVDDMHGAGNINTAISHSRMEQEHSASILIPYIYHYLPGVEVAPVLLNRSLSFNATMEIFRWLEAWINESGKNVLLVASIDFSHFLTVPHSREMDRQTKEAIFTHDLRRIHEMTYHNLDSPAAMIIFLMYLESLGLAPQIIAHTDASEFLGPGLQDTTSYMIITGTQVETTRVQLTFTGDIMLHQMHDFERAFDYVRPFLQAADLTIGNLETVLAGFFQNDDTGMFPLFSAPDEFAVALRNAGFDILSTANNHSLDQGVAGLLRTIDVLYNLGIANVGTYHSQADRNIILIWEVQGISFAFLSYTFGTNGQPIPPGRGYLVNMLNENLMREDIARARRFADFVIVMPHMGYEYELTVRPHIEAWAMLMLEAGADVVVAGHPHVLQPMGFVDVTCAQTGETRQGFIAYCLGNFISGQRMPHTYNGVMLNLYFERVGDAPPILAGMSYVATSVQDNVIRVD